MKDYSTSLAIVFALGLYSCAPATQIDQTVSPANSRDVLEAQASEILNRMSLEEKIGQVIQADIASVTPQQVKDYNLGSILNGGNSAPGGEKTAAPAAWIALADAYWDASTDTSDGGVGIPALWGTDAVHGHNNLQSATIFPHNSALGAANDPALIKEIAQVTAREVRATGIDWTFAPTLAVARDDRWGRAYESYSENPELVARYSSAMVEGLQGLQTDPNFLKGESVIATAKHFVGDGGTQFGIDKGDAILAQDELMRVHGAGYGPAFAAGVQTVMASFSSVNGEKMHGSKQLLTDVLRGEMGFDGFVVGDWNGHAEIPNCTATDCPQALQAGVDMYMAPDSWKGLYDSLLAQAKSGELPIADLDRAVTRILRVKLRSGLFEAGRPSKRASANPNALGTEQNAAIAREAVRKSLVLLKNDSSLLPLAPNQNILVTGSGADSMQQQTGGWTLNWQGTGNDNSEFETGETIFAGIEQAVSENGGTATLSDSGDYTQKPDVAIVVFGEQPYAEYRGDSADLVFEFENGENLALIKRLKSQGIKVVSVFLTGRPLWVNPHLNASDAFVTAWLPGTEGGGIADVIIAGPSSDVHYDFTGRLSFTWPADGAGKPINMDDADADQYALFPYGYGLSYGDKTTFTTLSEDSKVTSNANFDGKILSRGDASKPFQFFLGDSSNLNTPANELVSASLSGAITTRGIDYKAQEDARQVTWTGNGKASASLRTHRPIDIASLASPESLSLKLQWRIDNAPQEPIYVSMGCGDGCIAQLDISNIVAGLPVGQWSTTAIPLDCFEQKGLATDSIDTGLSLTTSSKASLTLHAAELTQDSNAMACPT